MEHCKIVENPFYKVWANPVDYELPPPSSERCFLQLTQTFFTANFSRNLADNSVANNRVQSQVYSRYIEEINGQIYRRWRCCGILKALFIALSLVSFSLSIFEISTIGEGKQAGDHVISMVFWLFLMCVFALLVRVTTNLTFKASAKSQPILDAIYRTRYMTSFAESQIYVQVGLNCMWLEFGLASRMQYVPPVVYGSSLGVQQ